jgi:hypothetical protein
MSMARLWRDQGKRDEARELLAPIYVWFTGGFDTRGLKEAKKLVDELAPYRLRDRKWVECIRAIPFDFRCQGYDVRSWGRNGPSTEFAV